MRQFYRFALAEGWRADDPSRRLDAPKQGRPLPKTLTREEIDAYAASGEGVGKAGGYAIQGIAGSFVVKLVGSYTNVVGLPLYDTLTLLSGEGFDVHAGWADA